MEKQEKRILVIGATGKQGGATARHLLARGWTVRGFVRNPDKPSARDLAGIGMEVAKGDLDNRASLDRAMLGVYGVFCVLTPYEAGTQTEVGQGKIVADAAKAAGVQQFVYSSVDGADRQTGIPVFDSKWQVEQYLRRLSLPPTILRPVRFMENFNAPGTRRAILDGTLMMTLRWDKPLQMVAIDDIGAFAAMAFERPQEFLGEAIAIAGDERTMPEAAEIFSRVIGRPVRFVEQPMDEIQAASADFMAGYRWLNDQGYQADIPAVRAMYPPLMTLEAWLRKTGWASADKETGTLRDRVEGTS